MSAQNTNTNSQDIELYEKAYKKYYKMKSKYETEIKEKIKQFSKNKPFPRGYNIRKVNIKYVQKEMQNFKAHCQNCKRAVGMIFTTTYNEEKLTPVIKCVCGDSRSPCNLNITLETGTTELLQDNIKYETKEIDDYKKKIIIDKNKLLFSFLDSEKVLNAYEEYKEELNASFERYDFYFQEYNDIVNNKQKEQQIKALQVEYNNYVQELRENMKKFEVSRERHYLESAMEIHNKISNKANELLEIKYKDMRVEREGDTDVFVLFQDKVTIPDLETVLVKPSVISFVTNLTEENMNTNSQEQQEQPQEQPQEQSSPTEEKKSSSDMTETSSEKSTESNNSQSGFELIEENITSLFK